jgi:hypothetical protein
MQMEQLQDTWPKLPRLAKKPGTIPSRAVERPIPERSKYVANHNAGEASFDGEFF